MMIVMVTTCAGRTLQNLLRRHLSFHENLVSKGRLGRPPRLIAMHLRMTRSSYHDGGSLGEE